MMGHVRAWTRRLAGLFNRDLQEQDLRDELDSHVQMHIDDNVRAGMTPEAARRDALLRLGGMEQTKEQYRDRRRVPVIEHLAQDIRFGVRVLRRSPTFTAVAVLTLGLGIGANTAIFSVVNAVLLQPLPFPDSSRLVLVWATDTKTGIREDVASYPDFEEWKARAKSFDGLAAFTGRGMTLAGAEQAEHVPALQVTPGFFETLGVPVALGRTLRAEDGEPGAPRVMLLGDGAWKRYFGGRPDVLGQTLRANEEPHTIVGVMPPGLSLVPGEAEQVYVPLARDPSRNHGFLRVLGRLRPDVTVRAAQAELDVIASQIALQFPRTNASVGVNIVPLVNALVGSARTGLLVFLGVVMLVLLIACTNVANLMLARNATREKELALRTALGAGRRRLVQQLLTESAVLALAGGALGLLLATWGTQLLVALLADGVAIARIESTRSDGWVLAFTLAISLATGVLFGGVPALVAGSPHLNESLRESSRSSNSGVRSRRARAMLMIAETALAMVLLAGAGMLLENLAVLRATAPGFTTENLLAVDVSLPRLKYARPEERTRFFNEMVARVQSLSGVRAAGLVANLPLGGGHDSLQFRVAGRPATDKPASADFNIAGPGYFRTMGIPVSAGREFTAEDRANTPPVVVINESAARRFWPGESPLEKQIILPVSDTAHVTLTVVGVTGDVRQAALSAEPKAEIFLASMQPGPDWPGRTLVVRTASDPLAYGGAIKSIVRTVDGDVPVTRVETIDAILSGSLAEPRIYTTLLATFAALALTLAAVGLYGVVSYTAAQRTHEMGIRTALGARRADVMRLILGQGTGYTVAGIVIGLGGAIAFMRLLATMMPGAEPRDAVMLATVSALLLVVALAASYVPARRAARVDPIRALRAE